MNILFCAEDDNIYNARETLDGKGYYIAVLDLFLPHEMLTAVLGVNALYIVVKGGNKEKSISRLRK